MKKFKIYGFVNSKPILITDSEAISPASTYGEAFNEEPHMKTSLNFKIMETMPNGEINPHLKLLYSAAKLRLIKYERRGGIWEEKIYDHIITNISSDFYKENIEYSFSCEDYASVRFSKEGAGLEMEFTGTFRESIQELLVVSNKNMGYKDLHINHLKIDSYKTKTDNIEINNRVIDKIDGATGIIKYIRERSLESSVYNFSGKIFDATISQDTTITIKQYNPNLILIGENQITITGESNFSLEVDITKTCFEYEIHITSSNSMSIGDLAIKKIANNSLIENSLHIAPGVEGINDEDYLDIENVTNNYIRSTVKLSGSNLYNGLVDIATLFNSRIYFDYSLPTIALKFVHNKKSNFKGYKISPEFNINSIMREESTDEFLTVLHIVGDENVPSVIPNVPLLFKNYFAECIENNFAQFLNFGTQAGEKTYTDIAIELGQDLSFSEKEELLKFAKIADLIPNLENTVYNVNYFKNINVLSSSDYEYINNIIVNKLRKINIKFRIFSEAFYIIDTLLKAQESEISFLSRNITTEEIFIKETKEKMKALDEDGELKIEPFSNTWVVHQNRIISSRNNIALNTKEIMDIMGITYDEEILEPNTEQEEYKYTATGIYIEEVLGNVQLKKDSYLSNLLNMYGYYNNMFNGLEKKIIEVQNKILEEFNQRKEFIVRLEEINNDIETGTLTSFAVRTLEVERSGILSRLRQSRFLIGVPLEEELEEYINVNDPLDFDEFEILGELHNQLKYLLFLEKNLTTLSFKPTLINYSKWWLDDELKITPENYGGKAYFKLKDFNNMSSIEGTEAMIEIEGDVLSSYVEFPFLGEDKNYRFSGLIYIDTPLDKDLAIRFNSNQSTITIDKSILNTQKWIGFELFNNEPDKSKIHYLPIFTEAEGAYTVSHQSGQISSSVRISIPNNSTGKIYLYRPRLEETSLMMPTIDEMFALLDNPIGIKDSVISIKVDYEEGLYDLLKNYASEHNLERQKREILTKMYNLYPEIFIEGYYENSSEVDIKGLLEQALLAMETFKYPRIGYNTTIIDMSAIENYEFLHLNIGDKILISEPKDKIYKSYDNDDNKFLEVESISYDLRNPENTTISVKKDKEIEKILQSLISQI